MAVVMVTSSLALSERNADGPIATKIQATYDNDVSVDSINSPSGIIQPGDVTVNATVTNGGNLSSGAFQVNLTIIQTGLPELAFNDSFETGSVPPPGWGDYSTGSQIWLTTNQGPHSGVRCLRAMAELYGRALLGSPAINVSFGSELEFWMKYVSSGALSELYVTVSTVGHAWANLVTAPNATLLVMNTSTNGSLQLSWTQYSCDLSAFANQTIYIGFIHNQPLYGDDLYIDDVTVVNQTGSIPVFSDTVPVSNLDAGNSMFVEFSTWTASEGNFRIEVNVYLAGDQDPANDLITANITVEQVIISEFSAVLVPVVAMAAILLVSRRSHRGRPPGDSKAGG